MIKPAIPANEKERIEALRNYHILDTLPESDFDDLTKIASEICQTPMSLITLIDTDRQWFKSAFGLERGETSRELAFCAHAIINPHHPLIVSNTTQDERFYDHPAVIDGLKVMFYAGVPLNTPDGYPLGTLCVVDSKPKELTQSQVDALTALAHQVVSQMELRKKNRQLEILNREFSVLNQNLQEFSYRVSHDLKTPLRGIKSLSSWLIEEYEVALDEQGINYLQLIQKRTDQLDSLINGILEYSKVAALRIDQFEMVDMTELIEDVLSNCQVPSSFQIDYPISHDQLRVFKVGLYQILQNLVSNSVKYNDKSIGEISIDLLKTDDIVSLIYADNGPGIAEEYRQKVFQLFETLGNIPKNNETSVGVGLATVKSLSEKMGGDVKIIDRKDGQEGVCFVINLKVL